MDSSPRGIGGGMGFAAMDSMSRAEEPGVDWMFPPPNHISFPGNFAEARELAKVDKKWLLVNLQEHTEFSSHMLNRDTWSNEMVESMVRTSFVFWQRGSSSGDGQDYMRLYSVAAEALPHIAIIDARTGSKAHVIKVREILTEGSETAPVSVSVLVFVFVFVFASVSVSVSLSLSVSVYHVSMYMVPMNSLTPHPTPPNTLSTTTFKTPQQAGFR